MLEYPILTIRFNDETWEENCRYRENKPNIGCIYGSPSILSLQCPIDSLLFVVEMNNSSNQIEGIGLIKNRAYISDTRCFVYTTKTYNRYIYKGSVRISREIIEKYNKLLLDVLDYILFKEKTHLKRGHKFMRITDKLYNKSICLPIGKEIDFKKEITRIFKCYLNEEK
jgi:hypothetical protein